MAKHTVTLIPGDGIGPELTTAMTRVVEATGVDIAWEIADAGSDQIEKYGTPLPESTLDSIRKNKVAIKGPITTPVGGGFRSVNVAIRKELDLYACLRPAFSIPGSGARYDGIDIVIVRENTEDLYAGIEFDTGADDTKEIISTINRLSSKPVPASAAISIKSITPENSERIVRFAFDYAIQNERKLVTSVHKANIMKFSDGLFLKVSQEVAKDYPQIDFNDRIVDNMCMQLMQRPEDYDVLVMPNLYGDVLSDLTAGMVGGLGVAPSANIGEKAAIFEPIHGSAPSHAGKNEANPSAMILSGAMMLRHLGELQAAKAVEDAVAGIIADGKQVTYDLRPDRDRAKAAGTSEMADAIIARLGA
jgi:isocitrate dehydrogenase (NAD+)